ncbi:MAG: hypothetical protein M3Y72_02880 [Acidobacteriota bacterium]|nr:hypothetical protein [Acidobacteriota bacterium]
MRILLLLLCFFGAVGLQAQSVEAVLSRMDAAAPRFHAMSADIKMLTHTAVIDDTENESGTFKMQRLKGEDVRAILDFSREKDARVIAFLGKIVRIYYPNAKTYQDYDLGKSSDVLNQFLLLGFGSSGRDLAASYHITGEGQEKVAGRETTKLLLVPKSADVGKRLSKVEVWIPNDAAYPVQQKFVEPSENYRIVTYSNIDLTPSFKGNKLDLKVPAGAKKQGS